MSTIHNYSYTSLSLKFISHTLHGMAVKCIFAVLGCVHTFSSVLLVQKKKEDTFSSGSLGVHTVIFKT